MTGAQVRALVVAVRVIVWLVVIGLAGSILWRNVEPFVLCVVGIGFLCFVAGLALGLYIVDLAE
jgi:hypothetical protein